MSVSFNSHGDSYSLDDWYYTKLFVYKNKFCTAQKMRPVSIIRTSFFNVVCGNNWGLLWATHKTHKNTLCGPEQNHLPTVTEGSTCTLISRLSLGLRSKSPQKGQNKYEEKSLNNRNFILKYMEKYAQRKIVFRDTKWQYVILCGSSSLSLRSRP